MPNQKIFWQIIKGNLNFRFDISEELINCMILISAKPKIKQKWIPEMAPPYADALPDLAGPGRRALGQGARQNCVGFSEPWVLS